MLERLIGLLPIILLFVVPALIALRRATRRRRQARAEALAAGEVQAASPDRPAEGFPPRQAGPVPGQIARTAATEVQGAPATGPARELYVYPPPLELKRLQAASGAAVAGAPALVVGAPSPGGRAPSPGAGAVGTGRRTAGMGARAAGTALPRSASPAQGTDSRGEVIWRRLGVLPPLQRAIAFSEILGPPRGLTGPAGSLASEREL